MENKTVLLIFKNQNLSKIFIKGLNQSGYEVKEFYEDYIPYGDFSYWQKILNIFHRMVFKNKNYIHKIFEKNFINHSNVLLKKLKSNEEYFDYCFVIRGDLIPENVLLFSKKISSKIYDYQFDGMNVSNKILDYMDLFNKVYFFDKEDLKLVLNDNARSTTNFFIEENNLEKIEWDFYYVGIGVENRFGYLNNFLNYFKDKDYKYNINLGMRETVNVKNINFLSHSINSSENILNIKKSRVLLDIKLNSHEGLSFRFFDALNFSKKIITNNSSVKTYDFYHPDNIFITDFLNFEGLDDFLKIPYKEIDIKIKNKYNFKYWIKNIFEEIES